MSQTEPLWPLSFRLDIRPVTRQRLALPRPHVQCIQQRMYPLEHHASTSSEWLDWSSAGAHKQDRRVSVTVQFLDRLEPVEVRMLGADSPSLVASLAIADYAVLEPGPAVTLRLVRSGRGPRCRCNR